MPCHPDETETPSPAVETHLLGRIGLQGCIDLQRRLIDRIGRRDDGQIALLLCEHDQIITVGRGGSPADVATESRLIRTRQIDVQWVNRGGPCMVHCPGQLAVYPVAPLRWHGFSVGEFLDRFQSGIVEALDDLNIPAKTQPGRHGIWGRTGQLAAVGIAVRDWVTYHGAFLNVCPRMGLFKLVETDPVEHTKMSCLVAERQGTVKMTAVRSTLVRRLAEALGCDRYHLHTGHPMLRSTNKTRRRVEE